MEFIVLMECLTFFRTLHVIVNLAVVFHVVLQHPK